MLQIVVKMQEVLRQQFVDLGGIVSFQPILELVPIRKKFECAFRYVRERSVAKVVYQCGSVLTVHF